MNFTRDAFTVSRVFLCAVFINGYLAASLVMRLEIYNQGAHHKSAWQAMQLNDENEIGKFIQYLTEHE